VDVCPYSQCVAQRTVAIVGLIADKPINGLGPDSHMLPIDIEAIRGMDRRNVTIHRHTLHLLRAGAEDTASEANCKNDREQ